MEESPKKLFDDVLISTPIDKMMEIIKENKEVNLDYVASKLNENIQKVEEWASILEDQGIIKVDYALSKVMLKWNAPTKAEGEKRSVEYKEGRESFEASLGKIREEMEKEARDIGDYNRQILEALARYQPEIEGLKKDFMTYKEIGGGKGRQYVDLSERIVTLNAKVDQISDHLAVIEMNMKQIKEEMSKDTLGKNIGEIRLTKDNIDKMIAKMSDISAKIAEIKSGMKAGEIDEDKLNEFMKKAPGLEDRVEGIEAALKKVSKSQDLVKDAEETVTFFSEHIVEMEKKAKEISDELDKGGSLEEMETRINNAKNEKNLLKEELEETKSAVSTVSASLKSSMPELGDLAPLKEMAKEIDEIKGLLSQVSGVTESVQRLREVDRIIEDISQLNEQVEGEKEKLAREVGDLIKLADEEVETYKTFERIRDRVVSAVDAYSAEISRLKDEYGAAKKDMDRLQKEVERISSSISAVMGKDKEGGEMVARAEKLLAAFDKIRGAADKIDALKEDVDRLNKNIILLEKEYRVMELRNPEAVGGKVQLAEAQMEDYKKKKKELAETIKKMWEDDEVGKKRK